MNRVLGVDPGGTTGVCLLEVPDDAPAQVAFLQEIAGGTQGFVEWWSTYADIVVCESFALDGRTPKPDLTPVEIIGALKAFEVCNDWCSWDLVFQTNTQGKSLLPNAILKRAGYYPERGQVKGGHGVDALRHALTYICKQLKHAPTINKLYPREES